MSEPAAPTAAGEDNARLIADLRKNSRERLRVRREFFKGHDLITLRVWAPGKDGVMVPTKAGVALRASLVPALIGALQEALQPVGGGEDDAAPQEGGEGPPF